MEPTVLRNTAPPGRSLLFFGYVAAVVLAALAVTAAGVATDGYPVVHLPDAYWLMLVLAVATDIRPLNTAGPRQSAAVFPSVCFSFAALLVWGVPAAVGIQVIATATSAWRLHHRPWRALFNAGQYAVALAAAGVVLDIEVPGTTGYGLRRVVLVLAAATVWFLVSHVLVTVAVWLRFGGPWTRTLRRTFGYEALSTFGLLLVGPILAAAAATSAWLVPLITVPLYGVHRTARLSREQERLVRLDPLTGLPNRKALEADVAEAITAHRDLPADAPDGSLALIVLDLDRFKQVNDALGHAVGDRLLVDVGRRIVRCLRDRGTVARLGGDEYAVVAPRLSGVDAARDLANRIAAALAEPVHLDGLALDVACSIGIAMYPTDGEDFATLLRHADVAMYEAKTRGDSIAVYTAESDQNSADRLGLLGDLRRSLETQHTGEVSLYYQPQVALATGEVVGVEALLRWRHPERGLVSADELIRVAEPTAVMRLLTHRVIDEVVAQLERWTADGTSLRAAINVSVRDLHAPELVDHLADALARHGVPASQVKLEITEGALMADPRRVLATLHRLDKLGVALSLDDFGTGYSSMQHLRRLPLSEVKIDRSFVLGVTTDEDDASIVRSIIDLAGALNLRVVAEGVEDERTWRWLAAQGCDIAQGWFYGRPMPADALPRWLARYRPPRLLRPVPAPPAAAGA